MLRSLLVGLVAAVSISAPGAPCRIGPAPAEADLVLNEVLYDPAGPDEGAEWVELWNPDPVPRSLAGIVIEAADGAKPDVWTTVFRGAAADTAAPGSAFLVAGAALTGALQNGPDALRLVREGAVLDRLGYGALESASLYEGSPAPDVPSGHSLARRADGADGGSNADDWEDEGTPTPGRANHPAERLVLGVVSLDPAVPWPGEPARIRAVVNNRGRLPLAASRWRLVADTGPRSGPLSAEVTPGLGVAAGESVEVTVAIQQDEPGPFRALVRIAAAEGTPPSADLADTASVLGRALAAPAVVSEIAFRDEGAGEWVELWLRDAVSDAGALALADASSPPRFVARGAIPRPLPAGSYLVLAQDPAAVRARYGLDSSAVLGLTGPWPSLNDTDGPGGIADFVRVIGADSIPSDVVAYDARAVTRGGTLERLSPDLPGHVLGTFGECVDPARATPNRPNSLRAPEGAPAARGALLLASGRVLRAGAAAPLLLRLTAEARGRSLVVGVYDLLGRRVRTLVEGQRFATEGAFAWDGRDAAGSWVRPGLYVIAAEAAAEAGLGPRRTAIPIAVSPAGGAR